MNWAKFVYYPCHCGHQGWRHYSSTIYDVAIEDLIWRNLQFDAVLLLKIANYIYNGNAKDTNTIIVNQGYDGYRISLRPNSFGSYGNGCLP